MKKHKSLPLIICATILLAFFAQEGLLTKPALFLDIEKEGRSCEIKDYAPKKSLLFRYLAEDAIVPALASLRHFCAYFAVSETPARAKTALPFLCKIFNHSPPSII